MTELLYLFGSRNYALQLKRSRTLQAVDGVEISLITGSCLEIN